jgi:glutamate 5-kinase
MKKELLVIKFGTASITLPSGEPDHTIIENIAIQIAELAKTYRIVMVSSGAVGAGKHFIKSYTGEISQRKAAAAIGNPILLTLYALHFSKFGINVAQSLCERQHFANREQFLQLKETYQQLWENDIIPIANENDVVSSRELKFSDNDELATLIAVGFEAKTLMICTQSGGLLDKSKNIVPTIKQIDDQILGLVDKTKSSLGTGGMSSKLTFTKLANKMGIKVIIFGLQGTSGIISAYNQKSGSAFLPQKVNISARNRWLASGGLTVAKIVIDLGAEKAIKDRKSLLKVGVVEIEGEFEVGEIVEIVTTEKHPIAVCRTKDSSYNLGKDKNTQNNIVAHADDIVLI